MSAALLPLALAALVPVMVGPLPPAGESRTLTMHLCGGGSITIPLGGRAPAQERDCHPKACHAGTCREHDKSGKLISRKAR